MNKAFTYTLEAAIASSLLLAAVGFYISSGYIIQAKEEISPSQILLELYQDGSLREALEEGSYSILEGKISGMLGTGKGFRLEIYNSTSQIYASNTSLPQDGESYTGVILLSENGTRAKLVVWYL